MVDGDTFVLADAKEHVRLIGADTPETVKPNWPVEPWGPEATAFTKQFLAGGEVRLEFDGPPRDKYGRMLAFVWVGDRMLNEELIRAGLARAELQYPLLRRHEGPLSPCRSRGPRRPARDLVGGSDGRAPIRSDRI